MRTNGYPAWHANLRTPGQFQAVDGSVQVLGGLTALRSVGGGPRPRRCALRLMRSQRHRGPLREPRLRTDPRRRRCARRRPARTRGRSTVLTAKAARSSPVAASRPTRRMAHALPSAFALRDLAKVRGSRFNTGDGLRMALEIGAMPCGNWSGCHAVGWDRNAPRIRQDLSVGDGFQKQQLPVRSIMVTRACAGASMPSTRAPDDFATTVTLRQVRGEARAVRRTAWVSGSPGRSSIARSLTCCATSIESSA